MSEERPLDQIPTAGAFRDKSLPSDTPMRFEGRNRRCRSSDRPIGQVYTIELEIDQETWLALQTTPRNGIFGLVVWWNDGDEPAPATKKRPSKATQGKHGQFWREAFKRGFQHDVDLRAVLEVEGLGNPDAVKNALHRVFDASSLSKVSPEQFAYWCHANQLERLVTMVNLITKGNYGQEDQRS